MNQLEFYIKQNKYFICLLDQYENSITNNKKLNKIYTPCFGNTNTIQDIIGFSKHKGITIVILDKNQNFVFLFTVIKNVNTRCLEIYNVCKDLTNPDIKGTQIIKVIIREFIIKNIFFKGYYEIRLAILLKNKYILQTLFCYQNIGFRYSNGKKKLSCYLPPHFTLELNLKNKKNLDINTKTNDFLQIINNHLDIIKIIKQINSSNYISGNKYIENIKSKLDSLSLKNNL